MTKVLIAVDDTDSSLRAARVAHRLFGDDASYLVVNVTDTVATGAAGWGYTYPVAMPMLDVPMAAVPGGEPAFVEMADRTAADVARNADLTDADTEGRAGDVPSAILSAAHAHDVDVIVVGSHERSWFSRLISGSVASALVRDADIPVLVAR